MVMMPSLSSNPAIQPVCSIGSAALLLKLIQGCVTQTGSTQKMSLTSSVLLSSFYQRRRQLA